jgi:hypothetical protein
MAIQHQRSSYLLRKVKLQPFKKHGRERAGRLAELRRQAMQTYESVCLKQQRRKRAHYFYSSCISVSESQKSSMKRAPFMHQFHTGQHR